MGSLFSDPVQLLGLIFIIITFITQFLLGQKLYRDYLRNKSRTTLLFSLTFLSWGSALLFLALERIALAGFDNTVIGTPFAYIAIVFSVLAIMTLDLFASYVTFPRHMKMSMTIICTFAIAFLIILFISGGVTAPFPDYEVTFPPLVRDTVFYTLVPLFFFPITALGYYSLSMRSRSPPHAKRAALVTMAMLCVILIYVLEVIGPHETINYFRGLYVVATVLFFISFTRLIELSWPQKIRHLYICHSKKGTCLYDHSFVQTGVADMNASLVGGFIIGLISLIQEITQSDKKLKVIDVEDIQIILKHGKKNEVAILMAEENYKILHKKLQELLEKFEIKFENELATFKGAVYEFETAKELVEQVFTYEDIF